MKMQMGVVAVLLWVVTVAGAGWFFVKGWTVKGTDGRMEISLAPSERDLILGEMRQLLRSVHGVVTGLSDADREAGRKVAEQAARAGGMGMAEDMTPAIMLKLPLALKQMGMSVHRDFDGLADGIARGESDAEILQRLSSITTRCTTCHEMYRLTAGE